MMKDVLLDSIATHLIMRLMKECLSLLWWMHLFVVKESERK